MENSRAKMNHAIQGLKDAIQTKNSGTGKIIQSGNNTYVNCHKAHGKKLFVIIKYAVGLPGIGEEIREIWRNLKRNSNVITRRDLVRIGCIHGLWMPREEIAFTALPKIHSHSQIFRYLGPKHILSATSAQFFRYL